MLKVCLNDHFCELANDNDVLFVGGVATVPNHQHPSPYQAGPSPCTPASPAR